MKPSYADLYALRPQIAAAAQRVYDGWFQDPSGHSEEYGVGGICHTIAAEICDVAFDHGFDCWTVSSNFEVHVSTVIDTRDGIWSVDIRPWHYETGGGYCWRKIPGIRFVPDMVELYQLSPDSEDLTDYVELEG